jgi:hypothetical protein
MASTRPGCQPARRVLNRRLLSPVPWLDANLPWNNRRAVIGMVAARRHIAIMAIP